MAIYADIATKLETVLCSWDVNYILRLQIYYMKNNAGVYFLVLFIYFADFL